MLKDTTKRLQMFKHTSKRLPMLKDKSKSLLTNNNYKEIIVW